MMVIMLVSLWATAADIFSIQKTTEELVSSALFYENYKCTGNFTVYDVTNILVKL